MAILDDHTFRRLCRARDFAASAFAGPVGVAEMAAAAALSPFHFHRLFSAAFGETPHDFLSRLRIAEARRLLAAGNHSVTETCLEVGYQSLGSFSARFRRSVGLAPTAYQRELRRFFGIGAAFRPMFIPGCFHAAYGRPGAEAELSKIGEAIGVRSA